MGLIVVTPPEYEPVTLTEVKEYLRLDGNEHDDTLNALIVAARVYCEKFQNRTYVQRIYEYTMDKWQFPIYLPNPPGVAIGHFAYIDENDDTFYFNDYAAEFTDQYTKIVPRYNAQIPTVRLREVAGIRIRYGAGSLINDIPQTVKLAIKMFVGHRFENPEAESVPTAVHHLLWPDRVVPV